MISVLKEKCCSLELSIYERVLGGRIIMLTKILSSTTVFRISWALCINFFIVIIFHSITFMSDQANKNTYKTALVNIRDSFQKHFKNLTWNNLTKIWNWKYETEWKTVLVHIGVLSGAQTISDSALLGSLVLLKPADSPGDGWASAKHSGVEWFAHFAEFCWSLSSAGWQNLSQRLLVDSSPFSKFLSLYLFQGFREGLTLTHISPLLHWSLRQDTRD